MDAMTFHRSSEIWYYSLESDGIVQFCSSSRPVVDLDLLLRHSRDLNFLQHLSISHVMTCSHFIYKCFREQCQEYTPCFASP